MKKLIFVLAVLIGAISQAQEFATASVTASNLTSVITERAKVTKLTLTASTSSDTTFKFYDLSDTRLGTTVTNFAYTTPTSYATNWTSVTTNIYGVVVSNTFSGVYTAWTTVSATTAERPRTITIVVPGSSTRAVDVTRYLKFGLCTYANYNGLVEAQYEVAP